VGLSLGGSTSSGSSNATNSTTQSNTYSPGQTSLQNQLGSSLSSGLTAATNGTMSPGVAAQETASADQINKTSAGTGSRISQFLAARGFGKSGATGSAGLQTELARQSSLAGNNANFAQVQQGVNSQNLLSSLNYALTSMGMTGSGSASGSSSGTSFGAGATFGLPGVQSQLSQI